MIIVKTGDLFESSAHTLVNTVNCAGVMGKGIALEFKKLYAPMFKDYVDRCDKGLVQLGYPYFFPYLIGPSIVNFPTKKHWRSRSQLSDIVRGLDYFVANCGEWSIKSIAFPALGCGNGGLEWKNVGPLMYKKLKDLPIDVEIYAPFATPDDQLSLEFLMQNNGEKKDAESY